MRRVLAHHGKLAGVTVPHPEEPADVRQGAPDSATRADDATQVQLEEVRGRLLRDAAAAGIDPTAVHDALERAVKGYAEAPVRSFVGVLVERTVRADLDLRVARDADGRPL